MYLDFRFEIVWINCSYWNTFTLGPWEIIYEEDGIVVVHTTRNIDKYFTRMSKTEHLFTETEHN